MAYLVIVIMLILLQYTWFGIQVGRARGRTGVSAPATVGNDEFERYYRVHENTLEQVVVIVPAMYAFSLYFDPRIAAAIGFVYLAGRWLYARAYIADPSSRSTGFALGFSATAALVIASLVGAFLTLI